MTDLTRRSLVSCLLAAGASAAGNVQAQSGQSMEPPPKFNFEDVVRRRGTSPRRLSIRRRPNCRRLLAKLDFDAWRDIRFRPDKAFLGANGSLFRLQLFHLGHLFKRPVIVNTLRDGIPTPIPYAANIFDYGRTKLEKPLPVNVGFAGFRLHYPLNDPKVFDEVIAFLGASYFRFLGRNQRFGISARGLAVGAGTEQEEFPFFREFWIETPEPQRDARLDLCAPRRAIGDGAYRFDLQPGNESLLDVSVTLFPRQSGTKFGLAPLTSMFFIGENDRRVTGDFRPELHDSDGLLILSGTGEWIWRPAAQSGAPGDLGLSRSKHSRLRSSPARPRFRPLPGSRSRL